MLPQKPTHTFAGWRHSGAPWIWLCAAAVSICLVAMVGLLLLLMVRGLGAFWPSDVFQADYAGQYIIIGQFVRSEEVPSTQLATADTTAQTQQGLIKRQLVNIGDLPTNATQHATTTFDRGGYYWVLASELSNIHYPDNIAVIEYEDGVIYGYLVQVSQAGQTMTATDQENAWSILQQAMVRAPSIAAQAELQQLHHQRHRDTATVRIMDGSDIVLPVASITRAYLPNTMGWLDKLWLYAENIWTFISDNPSHGVFPAIVGTVIMVLLMSILVAPLGIIAAIYLHEYAKPNVLTRFIRLAVYNLAAVPSIIYGVFGLGFFIYFIGGHIDELLFSSALPSPTFGAPGLLWASLTLALLTLPVVIVAVEEGLSRIPNTLREGSLVLGATRAETLWRLVLPVATPAMVTGLILAIARAAGEVAPLMLVGVVKWAPALPIDSQYPYIHLDQQFMHLGFHIVDLGFQSGHSEASRPQVYATALLLTLIVSLLVLSAVVLRNRLRERYRVIE